VAGEAMKFFGNGKQQRHFQYEETSRNRIFSKTSGANVKLELVMPVTKAMEVLDISVSGTKAAELKAKRHRPKVDRAANERAMRNTRDEITAARAIYDEEDRQASKCDSAVMPHTDDDAGDSIADGTKARTIESFHRAWKTESLHKTKAMNDKLYYIVGAEYRRSYYAAGGTALSQPPPYVAPVQGYDEYREVPIVPTDKCLPYHEAAKVLDEFEIREVVEEIVVHGRPLGVVGKAYSDYATSVQAQAMAITVLRFGLIALRNHYDALESLTPYTE
jgi:hypothetical protein